MATGEIVSTQDRRGQFGSARPAFTVHRFKRTITINVNEEMADELSNVLHDNEIALKDSGKDIPPFMFEFLSQLNQAIDQAPPAQGEKPAMLAPNRPSRNTQRATA